MTASDKEQSVHWSKEHIDNLVPDYFEYGSTAYYGSWAYQCQEFVKLSNYFTDMLDKALQAYSVYLIATGIYQQKLLASGQNVIALSQEEYAITTKEALVKGYSEEEIQKILENIRETGIKNAPLRQAYENEVSQLSSYGEKLSLEGLSECEIAQILNEERRNLGIKYKDLTPQPLRDYIYKVNIERYGDKLGPTYEYLKMAGKTDAQIIESAARPNSNIDKLLEGFEAWLRGK